MTGLDLILIVFMLISALLAMVRGFAREFLSIISWASAAVGTLFVFLYSGFRETVRQQITPEWLADIVLVCGSFFLILILVSFVTIRISDFILDSRIGALDRSLGFVFGLGRGFLLVIIAILFLNWFIPPDHQPNWIAKARSKPLLDNSGEALINLLPDDPEGEIFKRLRDRVQESNNAPSVPGSGEQLADEGYRSGERQGLNQLLESTSASNRQ